MSKSDAYLFIVLALLLFHLRMHLNQHNLSQHELVEVERQLAVVEGIIKLTDPGKQAG
jgi:hypothetical protein